MLVRRAWPSLRLVSIAPSLVLCSISVHAVEGFDVVRFPVAGFHPFLAGVVSLGFGRIEGRSGSGGDGRGHAADYTEKAAAVHCRLLLVMHPLVLLEVPTPWPDARCLVDRKSTRLNSSH